MGTSGNRSGPWLQETNSSVCFGKGCPPGGFIKDLRYVEAYENSQQAMNTLRETVLRNSLLKKNQQNTLAVIAIGALLLLLLKAK
jgi:hypothetical protein